MRLLKAFGYSVSGLVYAFKNETAFCQEVICFLLSMPVLFYLEAPLFAKLMVVFATVFVLVCELANSAIEATIDRISEKRHPLSKAAKDLGSAMVLVAFIPLISVWIYVFLEHFGMIYRLY